MIDLQLDLLAGSADPVARLVASMPEAFTSQGARMFLQDAEQYACVVAKNADHVVGALVWIASTTEIEFLWLAVSRKCRRQGIGGKLVADVLRRYPSHSVATLKTADAVDLPEGTTLTAENYNGTLRFWESQGFAILARVDDYWADGNAALILGKSLLEKDGLRDS